jgi:uncharacterized protein YoaH (UPF0181 family)
MAQSIVSSLFGVPVDPIERIRMTEARGPEQAISGLISGQGASLRQNVNRMFGVVPPQEKLQQIIQQASQQVDLGTPEGMSRLADALAQHPEFAGMSMGLKQEANNMRMKQSEFGLNQQLGEARLGLTKAQTDYYGRRGTEKTSSAQETQIQELISRGVPQEDAIRLVYKTPGTKEEKGTASRQKVEELVGFGISPKEAIKIAYGIKEDKPQEEIKVGFDKTGKYTNSFGEVIPASEMSKVRRSYAELEKVLNVLNNITKEDIKNAKGIDLTGSDLSKFAGAVVSPKTLAAQTKSAAAEIKQRLENLPPGSASDADMRTAAKTFPGFGSTEALEVWINNTRNAILSGMEIDAERYGLRFNSQNPKPQKQPTSADALINKYLGK